MASHSPNVHDDDGSYSTPAHVLAGSAILIASSLGIALPVVGRYIRGLTDKPFIYVLGKCLGIGVLLGVALIHMLDAAQDAIAGETGIPLAREHARLITYGVCLVGVATMQCVNELIHSGGTRRQHGSDDGSDQTSSLLGISSCHEHPVFLLEEPDESRTQRIMSTIFLQLGIMLHSVFVGLSVGLSGEAVLHVLTVAVCFHQFFEGIALGTKLAETELTTTIEIVCACMFTLSAPLGTASGVALVSSQLFDVKAGAFLFTQGILDALCAGILLYLGFGMLFHDFPVDKKRFCVGSSYRKLRSAAMTSSFMIGIAVMAVIGIYA